MKTQIIKSIKKNYKSLKPHSFKYVRTVSTWIYIGGLIKGYTPFRKVPPLKTWSIKELLELWVRIMWIKTFNRGLYL
jgi:hypothetical protein